jgi:hypothetical protein
MHKLVLIYTDPLANFLMISLEFSVMQIQLICSIQVCSDGPTELCSEQSRKCHFSHNSKMISLLLNHIFLDVQLWMGTPPGRVQNELLLFIALFRGQVINAYSCWWCLPALVAFICYIFILVFSIQKFWLIDVYPVI